MCGDHAEARRMMESDVNVHRGHPDAEVFVIRNGVKSMVLERRGQNIRPIYDQNLRTLINRISEKGNFT